MTMMECTHTHTTHTHDFWRYAKDAKKNLAVKTGERFFVETLQRGDHDATHPWKNRLPTFTCFARVLDDCEWRRGRGVIGLCAKRSACSHSSKREKKEEEPKGHCERGDGKPRDESRVHGF